MAGYRLTGGGEGLKLLELSFESESINLIAEAGDFAEHSSLGWVRSQPNMDIIEYNGESVFSVPDNDAGNYTFIKELSLSQLNNLHKNGGVFGGEIALDLANGTQGCFTSINTIEATNIQNADLSFPFLTDDNRRMNAGFEHSGNHLSLKNIDGTTGLELNGVDKVTVVNWKGETVTNTVPHVHASSLFNYRFHVQKGLDQTMYLYVEGVLVGNPTFAAHSGPAVTTNKLFYGSGSANGGDRVSYIKTFGVDIHTSESTMVLTKQELESNDGVKLTIPKGTHDYLMILDKGLNFPTGWNFLIFSETTGKIGWTFNPAGVGFATTIDGYAEGETEVTGLQQINKTNVLKNGAQFVSPENVYSAENHQINLSSLSTTIRVSSNPEILERDPSDATKLKVKNPFVLITVNSLNPLDIKVDELTIPITDNISHTIPLGSTYWIGVKKTHIDPFFELIFNPEYTDFNSATEAIIGRADTDATIPNQISTVRNSPYISNDLTRTAYDYMAVKENTFLISGGDITPTAGLMTYTTEESQYWRFMTWIDTENRNYGTEPPLLQTRYDVYNRTGGFESPATLEQGFYDNNGVKTAVPVDKWAVTKVYHFAISNVNGHQRGKQFYDSLFDAQSRKGEEDSLAHLDFTGAVLTHLIFIKSGATDANNPEQVVFEKVTSNNISSSGDPLVGGLQQSGVIDWIGNDLLTINPNLLFFDRAEFRVGLVNRDSGLVKFVRTVPGAAHITVTNRIVNRFTFYGYDIGSDTFIQQTTPFSRTTLNTIIPLGKLWHRNKLNIDDAQTMPLTAETSHDYAGQLLALGALKQTGLNLLANGANRKVDLSTGVLEVLGGSHTSRENINIAQPATFTPLSFTPVVKAITTGNAILETVTDDPDYDFYDDYSGALVALTANQFGIHYFYIYPFGNKVDVFLIRGDDEYGTLDAAQVALQQKNIPLPTDLKYGFPFAAVIAKKFTSNLQIAIPAGEAIIVPADRFGSFGAGRLI